MTAAASKLYFATKILAIKCKGNTREQPKSLSFAVLGDQHRQKCRILIYANKNQHISVASIHPDFEFFICEDNDISYLDDAEDQWFVKFSDFNNFVDSFRQIFLCIFYARTPVDSWHMGKCYRRTHTAFRSPEIGDSVRVTYSLLRCDASGMKTCLSKDETIEIFQPTTNQFEHFLIKYVLSMLCADKKLVIFDSRRLSPLPGISKHTDIMGLDLHLIDITDSTLGHGPHIKSSKESLRDRMASLGQSIFSPQNQSQSTITSTQSVSFTDFVDTADFEVFTDPENECEDKISQEPIKEKNDKSNSYSNQLALEVLIEDSRKSYAETKMALTDIQEKLNAFIGQSLNTKVPQDQHERKSVQVQFSSDNKQRLVSVYRLAMSSQHKLVEAFSKSLSSSIDILSKKVNFLETRLNFISNLHKSASSSLIAKNHDLQSKKMELESSPKSAVPDHENYSIEHIKKILNYTYRSIKNDVVAEASVRGFDSTATEYFLQTLQKTIKNTLGKLQSGDK